MPASLVAQGYVMLAGGGSESSAPTGWSAEPYGWFVQQANVEGRSGIIVLSNSDTSEWLPNYFEALGASEAVNMTISTHTPGQIAAAISQAAGVFFKGGNQQDYLDAWRGTQVQAAVQALFEAGGAIAGTSAGAMIAGEFVSSNTESRGSTSTDNLRNPFNAYNNIETDFIGLLPGVVVDTHYFERGRPGRLLGMMGRIHAEFDAATLTGIGIDDKTAVMLFPDGRLRVSGTGGVQVFRLNLEQDDTEIDARSGRPLLIRNLPMHQLTHGFELNVATGEIIHQPDDAFSVPPMPETTLPALINIEHNDWDINYLNSPELSDDELRIVLDDGFTSTQAITNHQTESELIPYDEAGFDEPAWINVLFSGDRVFMNITPQQWKALSASELFQQRVQQGDASAIELLAPHLAVSGAGYATNLSEGEFISYDGRMEHRAGAALLPHFVSVDSTYAEREFYENRASAAGWLMHHYGAHIAVNGTRLRQLRYDGSSGGFHFKQQLMPALVMDAREGYSTATSPFVASGSSSHTRNAAAVSQAMMHVLPSGEAFQLYAPGTPVSAPAPSGQHPQGFELRRAYPNPFNPETSVEIRAESAMHAEIEVFNILGQKVYSRPAFALRSGVNRLGLDLRGESSGVYLLRVSAGGGQQSLRITLMK